MIHTIDIIAVAVSRVSQRTTQRISSCSVYCKDESTKIVER